MTLSRAKENNQTRLSIIKENDEMRLCAANEILSRVNKNVEMRCVPMRYCPELTRMFR